MRRRRRKRPLPLLLLLRLLLASTLPLASVVRCFNLDVRIPVIKTGGAHGESFFGYAVAQHRTAAALTRGRGGGGGGEAMVLVGAPQDENLQPGTTRSGALWKCAWNNDIQVSPVAPPPPPHRSFLCCTVLHRMLITRSCGICECFVTSVLQVPLGLWAKLQLPSSLGM